MIASARRSRNQDERPEKSIMTSRARMVAAMRLRKADRVPVMCQPSWGFVLQELPDLAPIDFWHNHDGAMARAFCEISRRFGFDGTLIRAVGRD